VRTDQFHCQGNRENVLSERQAGISWYWWVAHTTRSEGVGDDSVADVYNFVVVVVVFTSEICQRTTNRLMVLFYCSLRIFLNVFSFSLSLFPLLFWFAQQKEGNNSKTKTIKNHAEFVAVFPSQLSFDTENTKQPQNEFQQQEVVRHRSQLL
jgi:hypothetical protein